MRLINIKIITHLEHLFIFVSAFFSQVIRRMIVAVKVTLVVMIQVRRYLASPFAKEDPENISTMRRIQIFQSGRKPTARTNF